MRKLFLISLYGSLLFSCSPKEKQVRTDTVTDNVTLTENVAINEDGYELYEELQSSLNQTKKSKLLYPSNYGGSFLDTNGDFVVLIVKGYDTDNLDFVPKNAVIKPCKYPYNELLDVMDTISEYKPSVNREIYSNFMVSYIDEKKIEL